MESEEFTVRNSVTVADDATVLDKDIGMTAIATDDATVLDKDIGMTAIVTDDATVLDKDIGMTAIAADDATVLSAAPGVDATVYKGVNNPSRLDEAETQLDVPANITSIKGPTVKRLFTGEEVAISRPIFCIGRNEDADYAVSHNPTISRKHAEIFFRKGRYYIRDLGAKNRTYVNGKLLPSKGESEISSGDVIKLANEDFLFWL